MVTNEQVAELEKVASAYFLDSNKACFEIENRQEELEGILKAYAGMNDASAQILRQYFLNGGEVK